MTSTTKQTWPNGRGGGGKKHDNTFRRKTLDKSTEQTDHVPWICLPQGDLPTVHSCYTHRSSALPGGLLGVFPSLFLTTEGSWIHLGGRVAKPLISPLMPVPPTQTGLHLRISTNSLHQINSSHQVQKSPKQLKEVLKCSQLVVNSSEAGTVNSLQLDNRLSWRRTYKSQHIKSKSGTLWFYSVNIIVTKWYHIIGKLPILHMYITQA